MIEKRNYKTYNKEFKEEAGGIFGGRVKLNYEIRTTSRCTSFYN